MYRNSISSLIVEGDYIIGGTSARENLSPFVFVASLSQKDLISYKDLEEVIKGQRSIKTGFCRGTDKSLYAGTMPNKQSDGSDGDGHIIQVKIDSNGKIEILDLGCPIPGEGIFSLLMDMNGSVLYGISHPSGIFFKYDISSRATKAFHDLKPSKTDLLIFYDFAEKPEDYLGEKLVQDNNGLIYGSKPINNIFFYDPGKDTFNILNNAIPSVWGRRTLGQIESWAKAPDGKFYGGNAGDGQLFELDPETKKIKNLGKPIMANGVKGLVLGIDGRLYGIAGTRPAETHLFTFTEEEGFCDLGNPRFEMTAPGIEQGIQWRAFQIGSIVTSEDGKYIIMGEDEDLSQILVFRIESGKYNMDPY